MAAEEISLGAQQVTTLKELLRPGLKAVFVGLNPAPTSVERGHYYQGQHGRRFWDRLGKYQIIPVQLPRGVEDDAAFIYGFGFADLVRRPTAKGHDLTTVEKKEGVADLAARLKAAKGNPLIVFVYTEPWKLAREHLERLGYRVLLMPGPYGKLDLVDARMEELRTALGESECDKVGAVS